MDDIHYPHVDPRTLGVYYARHVSAMTSEGLHAKSKIAAQLGVRDRRIAELEAENTALRAALVRAGVCPYGGREAGETLGQCRRGFPGCACADDLVAAGEPSPSADAELRAWARDVTDGTPVLPGAPVDDGGSWVQAPDWLEEPQTADDDERGAAVSAVYARLRDAVKAQDKEAFARAQIDLCRLVGEPLVCTTCGEKVEPTDDPKCPKCHPSTETVEVDPVTLVERVLGVKWAAGRRFERIDLPSGPCGMVFKNGWWYAVDGDGFDVEGDRARPDTDSKRAASLAILRAIIDGRCVLPDSAPGLEVLTPGDRAALERMLGEAP